jgi:hypothetical protein
MSFPSLGFSLAGGMAVNLISKDKDDMSFPSLRFSLAGGMAVNLISKDKDDMPFLSFGFSLAVWMAVGLKCSLLPLLPWPGSPYVGRQEAAWSAYSQGDIQQLTGQSHEIFIVHFDRRDS